MLGVNEQNVGSTHFCTPLSCILPLLGRHMSPSSKYPFPVLGATPRVPLQCNRFHAVTPSICAHLWPQKGLENGKRSTALHFTYGGDVWVSHNFCECSFSKRFQRVGHLFGGIGWVTAILQENTMGIFGEETVKCFKEAAQWASTALFWEGWNAREVSIRASCWLHLWW